MESLKLIFLVALIAACVFAEEQDTKKAEEETVSELDGKHYGYGGGYGGYGRPSYGGYGGYGSYGRPSYGSYGRPIYGGYGSYGGYGRPSYGGYGLYGRDGTEAAAEEPAKESTQSIVKRDAGDEPAPAIEGEEAKTTLEGTTPELEGKHYGYGGGYGGYGRPSYGGYGGYGSYGRPSYGGYGRPSYGGYGGYGGYGRPSYGGYGLYGRDGTEAAAEEPAKESAQSIVKRDAGDEPVPAIVGEEAKNTPEGTTPELEGKHFGYGGYGFGRPSYGGYGGYGRPYGGYGSYGGFGGYGRPSYGGYGGYGFGR